MTLVKDVMSTERSLRDLVELLATDHLEGEEAEHTVEEAMQEADIHRLLVMEDGQLMGIITTSDVTRAVAEERA